MYVFKYVLLLCLVPCLCYCVECSAQQQNAAQPTQNTPRWEIGQPGRKPPWYPYNYVRRNDSQTGDYKVVIVPATNIRQAKLDAQTYHVGWNAIDAWMGQSRVMYCVLLKRRPNYPPGTQPIRRPIKTEKQERDY